MCVKPWSLLKTIALLGCMTIVSCQRLPSQNRNTTPQMARACQTPDPAASLAPADRVQLTHAQGFNIEYFDHYKVVTVSRPWVNSDQAFQYLLVQCGTPIPPGFEQAQVVTIPVQKVLVLSTTHLPFFDRLKALDKVIGIRNIQETSNSVIREKYDRDEVASVGNGTELNFERIVSLQPDLVTTFGIANVETSSVQRLQDLGLTTAVIAEYLEPDPLAQAEWIKFIAAFLNAEKEANQVFETIVQEYTELQSLTQDLNQDSNQDLQQRPTVLTGFNLNGTWYVAGGQSFIAQFIQDAGGTYLWSEDTTTGNIPLDFEAVFLKGSQAELWINTNTQWQTLADVIQEDDRYGKFKAWQTGKLFNNDAQLNPDGGNDYWESGIINPQIVLADLIKIIHPELLPDHQLFYYRQINP